LEKKRKRNKKDAEWDGGELFRIKDDLIFHILFHRNIPVMLADAVVVAVLKTVPGVFPLFFKLMVFPITIPDIIRTKRIQKIIYHIAFLLRKCSHLE
jgi:hypothetical protein